MRESGAKLIAAERRRQISKEGYYDTHDDEHKEGELALAALCYASPVPVFVKREYAMSVNFEDPWPWDDCDDKRMNDGNAPVRNSSLMTDDRIRNLVKAGALIAADIDRLQRGKEQP